LNPLLEIIARETRQNRVISFARFMELALYCPVYGYYEKEKDNVGKRGDFFTSVSVGTVFGELLAFQFSTWLEELSSYDNRLQLVEAGAHNGQLAKDILTWLREKRTTLFKNVEYSIMEPSQRRREQQEELLREFAGKVHWAADWSALRGTGGDKARTPDPAGIYGIIFSNELLDAMPVHRFGWDAARREWFEWGVSLEAEEFVWARSNGQLSSRHAPTLPGELLNVLPDEFTMEICPAAETWWRDAGMNLAQGKLLTIDYGFGAEELFRPERRNGSLRSYHRHLSASNVLANPGEQDITAHVNFGAIQAAGESRGLKTMLWSTQEEFLTRIAAQAAKHPETFSEWTPTRTRQFQTLTHPEHLGRSFRVLVQSRG
jgi:SAM-dependent MidA family methyltransferase